MKKMRIKQKFRTCSAAAALLFILPYIVSVFAEGKGLPEGAGNVRSCVKVSVQEGEVSEIEWNTYLAGVLAVEMSPEYGEEAMKAQAVLIRTQIYSDLGGADDPVLSYEYMTYDEMREVYGSESFEKNCEKYLRAVEETDDTVLIYGDGPAWVPYHQSSAGMTRNASDVLGTDDYPYLTATECPEDKEAPEEIQTYRFRYEEIQEKCRDFLTAESSEKAAQGYSFSDFEIQAADAAGYVSQMRIGSTVCSGDRFREALSLPSSAFVFTEGEDGLVITTTGKGHGLGMSMWTADRMAGERAEFDEILEFFFPGTELRTDMPEKDLL